MDDLLADFVAETREMLEASGGEIVAWEADPTDRARLDTIFRFVHTVKGNCGFFDFPRLERLSHAAEDALAEVRGDRREADGALVSAVLAIIDRIGEMTDAIEAGEEFRAGGDDALIAALEPGSERATGDRAGDNADADLPEDTDHEPATANDPGPDHEQPKPAKAQAVQRSIRLPVELLDEVMKGVSDLVLARNDLARRLREAGEHSTLDGPFERLSALLKDVRESTTRMRMQRLEHLFGSIPRLVRDLSTELGKQVMVDFEGGDVELDREMLEMVRDPLTHIIRNAIDHGIERPADRIAAGKREIGLLKFAARQSGNQISLVISDDGNGIDADRLVRKALAVGIRAPAEIDAMTARDKLSLIFEPGLSTAESVSSISGRGVGMDVVRANIEKIGGSIDIETTPGQGTSFHLKLPLTLSIMAALTIACRGQQFAVPRSFVEEIVLVQSQNVELARAGERHLLTFRGRRVPCIALDEILFGEAGQAIDWDSKTLILIRLATDDVFALAVERVHDHEDVVVKPIAPAIMATRLYAGTTLLDDGRPMMLLDVPSIAAKHGLVGENRSRSESARDAEATPHDTGSIRAMMFRALDGRRRAVRLDLVRRIDTIDSAAIDIEGMRAQVVVDGMLLPLIGHDGGPLPEQTCRLLRLSDGESEIAMVVAEVLDAVDLPADLRDAGGDERFEGIALFGGQPVPVIDGHRLFAAQASSSGSVQHGATRPTCRLPADSEWSRTILEPLVQAAGYTVSCDADAPSDVAIVFGETDPGSVTGSSAAGSAVIRLRGAREPRGDHDTTIYRYDRNGLLSALRSLRGQERA